MNFLDWIIVGLYFAIVFIVAGISALRDRKKGETSSGYFLAGRHTAWWIIGASLFAANIGSEHLVGLAGAGANKDVGIVMAQFEIMAAPCLLLLAWIFIPFYLKNGVFTMPEFLERRYSPLTRWFMSILSIILYVLTKISVTIFAGGVVFETLMGINFWAGAVIVLAVTGLYTILGGLKAVMFTDFLQVFMIFFGSIVVSWFGLKELGGWSEMVSIAEANAGPQFMSLWRPMSDPQFPWTGVVFGVLVLGTWYWCTDQFIVQRVLSARNINHARGGALFGAFLKLFPLFIFVIPGIIAFCLSVKGTIKLDNPDKALPVLVMTLIPPGLKGVVVAGFVAALTSSLASVFNSCSTLLTMDIYKKIKPEASEKALVTFGRLSTGVLIVVGLAWIPFMKLVTNSGLYTYLQNVQAYLGTPIASIFLLGLFWKRINGTGAAVTLVAGFAIGLGRLLIDIFKPSSGILRFIGDINFLHFGIIAFLISCCVLITVSLLTPAQDEKTLAGLTFQTPRDGDKEGQGNWMLLAAFSVMLMLLVGTLWLYFS